MENIIQQIDKANVNNLVYNSPKIVNEEEKKVIMAKLNRALILGNLSKQHVTLKFQNAEGISFKTEATIWGLTQHYVILKGARMIPIHSITGVEF